MDWTTAITARAKKLGTTGIKSIKTGLTLVKTVMENLLAWVG